MSDERTLSVFKLESRRRNMSKKDQKFSFPSRISRIYRNKYYLYTYFHI